MIRFITANWIWFVLIGAMLLMHRGHRGHGGGHGGGCGGHGHNQQGSADTDQRTGHEDHPAAASDRPDVERTPASSGPARTPHRGC